MVASFMPSLAFAATWTADDIKCWDWTKGSTTATLKFITDGEATQTANAPATVKYTGGVKCGQRVDSDTVTLSAKFNGQTYTWNGTVKDIDFPDHEIVKVAEKAPTCTVAGNKAYEYCKYCEDADTAAAAAAVEKAHHAVALSQTNKYWNTATSGKVTLKEGATVTCADCGKKFKTTKPSTTGDLVVDVDSSKACATKAEAKADVVIAEGDAETDEEVSSARIIVPYVAVTEKTTTTPHKLKWGFVWGKDNGAETTAKYVQKCTECGYVAKEYDAKVEVTTDGTTADCTHPGKIGLKATYEGQTGVANATKTVSVSTPLGHKYEKVEEKAPTCTTDGMKAHYECTVCHKTFKINEKTGKVLVKSDAPVETDASDTLSKGHVMEGSWTWTKATDGKSYTAAKVSNLKCKNCGVVRAGEFDATVSEDDTKAVAPTCTKEGLKVFKAVVNGVKVVVPVPGSNETVNETCIIEATNEIVIPKADHAFEYHPVFKWNEEDLTCKIKFKSCTACDYEGDAYACTVVAEKKPEKTSTMTDAQYDALVKSFEARNYDATCTKSGKITATATYTSDLGTTYTETKTLVVPKAAHKAEVIPAVAATVFATGSKDGVKCSVCGEILTAPKEVAKLKVGTAKISSLKAGKKSFTVKASAANATGYRVFYKKAGAKKYSYTTVKAKNLSKTVKKLSAGKKYTVKVKAYAKNYDGDGEVVWGALSSGKTVKVK